MSAVVGGVAGALVGLGILLVALGIPWFRSVRLADRIAPYLVEAPSSSRLLAPALPAGRGRGAGGTARRLGAWLDRKLGADAGIVRRLERAGRAPDPVGYRAEQVVAGLAGAAAGLVLAGLLWVARTSNPLALAVLVVVCGVTGALAMDWRLSQQVSRREALITLELPTVAELLVLSVTAGEGIAAALERLARTSTGALAQELELVVADVHSGVPLTQALDGLSRRVALPAVSRFVDGVVIAIERGTPLADVLRAQATDAREAGRHQVIAEGGKREIRMMVPVVFLILPVTVLFAIFPGMSMLRLDL